MNNINSDEDMQWMILCTACGENPWYFNVASLHYEWVGGEQTVAGRRAWYKPLLHSFKQRYIKGYVDQYTPRKDDANLFDVSYIEATEVDFRRRIHFRATRKGWATYRKHIKAGRKRPDVARNSGCWIVEDERTGATWSEDLHGNRLD